MANDFRIFKKLFDYDFKPIESALGIDCFTQISNYKAIVKKDLMYNHNVSEKVRALSKKLEAAKDEQEFFDVVTGFYKAYGVGMFGLNKAFRIEEHLDGGFSFMPINNMDAVMLDDLIGYEIQKKSSQTIQKRLYREKGQQCAAFRRQRNRKINKHQGYCQSVL